MVYVVGLGPGNKDYILPKAIEILKNSNLIIGFSRALSSLEFLNKELKEVKTLKEILNIIESSSMVISIVASGDPTFYGIAEYLKNNYSNSLEVIPGISSFQYLTCKLGKSWNNAYLGSLHGRDEEFIENVKNNELSIWLTDKKNNPIELCKKLIKFNINSRIYIGENLSYNDEKIIVGVPEEIIEKECSELSVIIIERRS